jgi:hypothetical protein
MKSLNNIINELNEHETNDIALETGLSYAKVRNIKLRHCLKPSYEDVLKIIQFLERADNAKRRDNK